MQVQHSVPLAPLTSLGVGGPAETLVTVHSTAELTEALHTFRDTQLWYLGYGTNSLISDAGLPGTTLLIRNQHMEFNDGLAIIDAGVWWDDFVQRAITEGLWGVELMSAIPGGVGAAVVGNIAAYGQSVAQSLAWIECIDTTTNGPVILQSNELSLDYRYSNLQEPDKKHLVITRVAFNLSPTPTTEVTYQRALDVATEHDFDISTLDGRRQTIILARKAAGSLWDYRDSQHDSRTAGSFFRNPIVTPEQAETLMSFDETGKTAEQIQKMNQVHGGNALRVSSAHVLLAAGFQRGQQWGPVRLHPDHVLKIEALDGATATNVHDVVTHIVSTVQSKLGITITPEVRVLGSF